MDVILKVEDIPELFGDHLKADTRVMFHVMHADRENGGNISVRGTDTVILVANADKVENPLWLDTMIIHECILTLKPYPTKLIMLGHCQEFIYLQA